MTEDIPSEQNNTSPWRDLFSAVVDETASDEQQQALNRLLNDSPQAVDEYLAYIDLHAALSAPSMIARTLEQSSSGNDSVQRANLSTRRWPRRIALGGVVGLLIAITLFLGLPPRHAGVVLIRNVGADVRYGNKPANVGAALGSRICEFQFGMVELESPSGVQMVIEGPARFSFRSPVSLILYEGRLTADVPPQGVGFRVETPRMEVVDLGTRFGVDVDSDGVSEVHVFQGEVVAKGNTETQSTKLLKGDAGRVSETGNFGSRSFRNAAFIHKPELSDLAVGIESGQRRHWQHAIQTIKDDPSLIACLHFDQANSQHAIHGGRKVQGRFPGVTAIEFVNPDDHIRFLADGVFEELTMMTWVRLDLSPTGENSLFHTDNWNRDGQVHWLVSDKSQMRFSLHRGDRDPYRHLPVSIWPESTQNIIQSVGRWVHLAASYQASRQAIRFYINGQFDNEVIDPVIKQAILSPAQIGNWDSGELPYPNRRLCGRLDEFIVLGRVMSDEEITRFHNAGSPYLKTVNSASPSSNQNVQ